MKKFFFFLIVFFCVNTIFAGVIQKTYYFSNPQITEYKGYQRISFDNTLLTAKAGNPVLPYHAISLLLPPGEEVASIEINGEQETFLPGTYNLYPYQPSRTLNDDGVYELIKNNKIYNSKEIYPVRPYGHVSTSFMNGYSFALSSFTPVKYIPADGKVSYFKKVTVKIKTKPSSKATKALKNLSSRKTVIEKVLSFAQNPSMIKKYPEKNFKSGEDYELLIITNNTYKNSFAEYQQLYIPRGIRSEVVTVEEIYQSMSGQDHQEKIRNYIIQEYQQKGVEYILLAGDVEIVPFRGFYCYVQSGSGYSDNNIPADLYYSALDGSWNDDGDNKWGEPDEDDLLPDIAVARMPFSTQTELNHILTKTEMYQNNPVLGEFERPLLVGEHLYDNPDTWGKDYLELLKGEHSDNGYTTIGIPLNYDIQEMYEHDANWSGSDLMNKINQGLEFVHHVGHANHTYVAKWTNSDITNSNFSGANGVNHNFTLMQTHGCDCGAFDYNDCILEKMVTIKNFAVAVIGNSRYGWFNEGQTEGPAAHLHREMVDALFHEKIEQVGKAFVECKIQTAPWVEAPGQWEEGALRWNFYDINVLGDPAMSVWTDEPVNPQVSYPQEIVVGSNSFNVSVSVNGEPQNDFTCTLIKDGEIKALGTTDDNGSATLSFIDPVTEPGEALLIVKGYNSFPDTNEVTFIPGDGAYVSYDNHYVNDTLTGNGNGVLDYNEDAYITLSMKNVGSEVANNVVVKLSTDDPFVTLVDSTENFGNIGVNSSVQKENAFEVMISPTVPDGHSVNFKVTSLFDNDTTVSFFNENVNAPDLAFDSFSIDDSNGGDGNGNLDPGETAEITVKIVNAGASKAFNVKGLLSSQSNYISITQQELEYGDMNSGDYATAVYEVSADGDTPLGYIANFNVNISADFGVTGEGQFSTVIGQKPVIVISLADNSTSADSMMAAFDVLTVAADMVNQVPDNLYEYKAAFVTLGIYSNNHVLTNAEGQKLADFLEGGGKLYMEGGDTWYYNEPTPVHQYFHINGTSDGSSSFETLVGDTSSFMNGFIFTYQGPNNWMDEIQPTGSAFTILKNESSSYNGPAVIAYDGESYKTIGSVCEFGGLQPGGSNGTGGNQAGYMAQILNFFGVNFTWTAIKYNDDLNAGVKVYPNPFKDYIHVEINGELKDNAQFIIYDLNGRVVENIKVNDRSFVWNNVSRIMEEGVYFYKLINGENVTNGKIIYTK